MGLRKVAPFEEDTRFGALTLEESDAALPTVEMAPCSEEMFSLVQTLIGFAVAGGLAGESGACC